MPGTVHRADERLYPRKGRKKGPFAPYQAANVWADLYGLIVLHTSRLFHEVLGNMDFFVKQRTSDLIETVL